MLSGGYKADRRRLGASTICCIGRTGGSDDVSTAPARDTTADVIMPSPRGNESSLRSDHRKNAPTAATMLAIIVGANSRRSDRKQDAS